MLNNYANNAPMKLNAVLIALMFCVTIFSKLLSIVVIIPYNIVFMEGAIILTIAFFNNRKIILSKPYLLMLVIVAVSFFMSALMSGIGGIYVKRLLQTVMYVLLPSLIVQYKFDIKSFRRSVLCIGILYALYLYGYAIKWISIGMISIDDTMDLSYTALLPLFTAIWTLTEKKENLIFRLLSVGIIVLLGYFMLSISANRGALVSLVVYIVLQYAASIKNKKARTFFIIIVVIISVIFFTNLVPALEWIDEETTAKGFEIKPLKKFLFQLNNSDSATSGREDLFAIAIDMIKQRFGMPWGIGSFYLTAFNEYPHNILLEVTVELGIWATLFVVYFIVKSLKNILYIRPTGFDVLNLMFCLSIPRLMVSSTIWENFYFWMMIIFSQVEKQHKK